MGVSVAAVILGLSAVGAGGAGRMMARSLTEATVAAPGLSASDIHKLKEFGYAEADYPILFGAGVGGLPVLGGIAASGLSLTRARRARTVKSSG